MDRQPIPFVDPYVAKRMKKLLTEEIGLLEEEMKENVRNRMEALKHFSETNERQAENSSHDSEK